MEVEVKAKINDFDSIKQTLERKGAVFSALQEQKDIYYKDRNQEPGVIKSGVFVVRVRHSRKGDFLGYKEITDRKGVWKEYETKIDNPEQTINILKSIGLVEFYIIDKKRISGNLADFELNLDEVKGLGSFLEVELISENGEEAQNRIINFLKEIGINEDNIERRGYGELWQEKYGGGIKIDEQT